MGVLRCAGSAGRARGAQGHREALACQEKAPPSLMQV